MREPRLQVQAGRSDAAGERSEQNPMPPASGASKSNAVLVKRDDGAGIPGRRASRELFRSRWRRTDTRSI